MKALIYPMNLDMEFHPGRSLHIHNMLCKNIIVFVFVVMFMLLSILVNISLSPKGALQNLLYDMASGEEKFLEKNLLAPYEIIAEKLTAPLPF